MSPNPKTHKSALSRRTIVLAGGGSGGHIVPLLSLARELKSIAPDCRVVYIGLRGEKLSGLDERLLIFDEVHRISSGKLRRYHGQNVLSKITDIKSWLLNARDFFKVFIGYVQARRLLRQIRPCVVLSKGGYGALPVGLAAARMRIPLITHDSDVVPGLANRFIGRWASVHATGQPAELYKDVYPESTIRYVGIPLSNQLKPVTDKLRSDYRKMLGVTDDCFVLLVAGGSLGSQALNDKTLELAPDFLSDKQNYIFHFCGIQHLEAVENNYRKGLNADQLDRIKLVGFSSDFYVYSGAADVVVSRGGASSLAELAAQRKACIIIPADFLAGGHQLKNVSDLRDREAVLVAENDISPQNLLKQVMHLKRNHHLRDQLGQNLGSLVKTDGAEELAKLILSFCR